jgi:hypothetical protein
MLRALAFIEARFRFHLQPLYITTRANHLADDLSRDNLSAFLLKVPDANKAPDLPSAPLQALLLDPHADWLSPPWRHLFKDISQRASPHPHGGPTPQQ